MPDSIDTHHTVKSKRGKKQLQVSIPIFLRSDIALFEARRFAKFRSYLDGPVDSIGRFEVIPRKCLNNVKQDLTYYFGLG